MILTSALRQRNSSMNQTSTSTSRLALLCLAALALGCASSKPGATTTAPSTARIFASPQAAVDALVEALRTYDRERLAAIFGPGGGEIISSGDVVADRAAAERFVATYDARHRLEADSAGRSTLIIGPEDWPFPVPIVPANGMFAFDAAAGRDEILNRRIGRNELSAEQVCLAIVDAQRDYAMMKPMGGDLPVYAQKVMSDPGTRNGLYWPVTEGEAQSPLGALVARAVEEGYSTAGAADAAPRPFHGYYYRLLTAQGPHATGGAADYEMRGKLIGGFGVVAYPAEYGNSGIMTFITNHDGVVYQRDLGADTQKTAREMKAFDPGPQWKRVADEKTSPSGE